jgi:hypothetical protein
MEQWQESVISFATHDGNESGKTETFFKEQELNEE